MLIDTHAHLNFKAFNHDFDQVIERSLGEDVWMINVGSKYETSKKAVEIAQRYDNGIFAALGLHPIHVLEQEYDENEIREKVQMSDKEQLSKIRELLKSDKGNRIVAVGETGLDYFHIKTERHTEEQIKKAQEKRLSS